MSAALPRLLAIAASTLLGLLAFAPAASAGPVVDRIQARGTVKVCIWPDYYGITWRNPRTQLLTGIDIELSVALAQDLTV